LNQRGSVWGQQLFVTFTLRRLSPWRSYTQPIGQLEGQRGRERRHRRDQLLAGKRGAAGGMHLVFANLEMVICAGLFALVLWFTPQGLKDEVWGWMSDSASKSNDFTFSAVYALTVCFVEPFYVAAGFAMYLNRRVELEAWDIEQEFRRAFA
jgi:hypothetical protein